MRLYWGEPFEHIPLVGDRRVVQAFGLRTRSGRFFGRLLPERVERR